MDAITLLRADHKSVEQLFKRFERAGDKAYVEKREIVDRIIEELSIHAAIEEQVLYPVARETVPATEDVVLESLEEHHIVKWVLSELQSLDPADERFDAKVTVLIENVRHHVEEEQDEFFPKLRDALSRTALNDLGEALAQAKKSAPTKPHPRMPDEPPGNLVGTVAGVVDRIGDNVSGIAQGSVTAVQDLIARIMGSSKPKQSPTGSSVARKRAKTVRSSASSASDGAVRTARRAKKAATTTAKTAAAGTKATATTAKKSARATKTTAKRAATTTGRTAKTQAKKTVATAKRGGSKPRQRATAAA